MDKFFAIGYRHGRQTGRYVSFHQASTWAPEWIVAEVESYLNGRDKGVAKDDAYKAEADAINRRLAGGQPQALTA